MFPPPPGSAPNPFWIWAKSGQIRANPGVWDFPNALQDSPKSAQIQNGCGQIRANPGKSRDLGSRQIRGRIWANLPKSKTDLGKSTQIENGFGQIRLGFQANRHPNARIRANPGKSGQILQGPFGIRRTHPNPVGGCYVPHQPPGAEIA